jgi:hypothetical protein
VNQRYIARVAATFLARTESTALVTDYVTATGAFVRTDAPPQLMELLRIEFRNLPPHGSTIVLHGMVTRQVPPGTTNAAPGVEVVFFSTGAEASRSWEVFIAHLCAVHPASRSAPVDILPAPVSFDESAWVAPTEDSRADLGPAREPLTPPRGSPPRGPEGKSRFA